MPYTLCAPVFVREDSGRLAPGTILSPPMGLLDVPALGRFYDVRTPARAMVVQERRLAPARPHRLRVERDESDARAQDGGR